MPIKGFLASIIELFLAADRVSQIIIFALPLEPRSHRVEWQVRLDLLAIWSHSYEHAALSTKRVA